MKYHRLFRISMEWNGVDGCEKHWFSFMKERYDVRLMSSGAMGNECTGKYGLHDNYFGRSYNSISLAVNDQRERDEEGRGGI